MAISPGALETLCCSGRMIAAVAQRVWARMAWVKIPKEHHPVFVAALPDDDRIVTKQMFGGLAAMLDGQMMAGLFGMTAMVKLGPADYAALVKNGGTPFDPMGKGRPMAETLRPHAGGVIYSQIRVRAAPRTR